MYLSSYPYLTTARNWVGKYISIKKLHILGKIHLYLPFNIEKLFVDYMQDIFVYACMTGNPSWPVYTLLIFFIITNARQLGVYMGL